MLNNGADKKVGDGGFPMAFESEHVPELLGGFQKLQQKAIEKQTELNARFEVTQMQREAEEMRNEAQS